MDISLNKYYSAICGITEEEMNKYFIYLFEFKRDDTAENALKQIDDKSYTLPFVADHRTLYKIGVAFDSEKRILSEWKVAED